MKMKREHHDEYYAKCGVQVGSPDALRRHTKSCTQCHARRAASGIDRLLDRFLNVVPESTHAREQLKVRIRELFLDEDGRLSSPRY